MSVRWDCFLASFGELFAGYSSASDGTSIAIECCLVMFDCSFVVHRKFYHRCLILMVPKLAGIVWLNLASTVECYVNSVNFADCAYETGESAGSIADEWQTFAVVASMLHFEFGFVVESLLAVVADIRFGICSLDDCDCAVMLVAFAAHFADSVALCYSDTLSLYRTNFDWVAESDGAPCNCSTWMNDYFVMVLCANGCSMMVADDAVTSDVWAAGGQYVQFVRNLK